MVFSFIIFFSVWAKRKLQIWIYIFFLFIHFFVSQYWKEAFNRGEVPVGCLIVFDGNEIGRGSNNSNEDKNATKK